MVCACTHPGVGSAWWGRPVVGERLQTRCRSTPLPEARVIGMPVQLATLLVSLAKPEKFIDTVDRVH